LQSKGERMSYQPKESEIYYFINVGTSISVHYTVHGNSYLSDLRIKIGNCFKTKKEATEKLREIKKILRGVK